MIIPTLTKTNERNLGLFTLEITYFNLKVEKYEADEIMELTKINNEKVNEMNETINNIDEQLKNDYFKANGTHLKPIPVPNGVMLQQKTFYNDEDIKVLHKALQKRRFEIEKEIQVIYNEINSLGLFDPTSIKLIRVLNEKYTSIEDIQREIDKNL